MIYTSHQAGASLVRSVYATPVLCHLRPTNKNISNHLKEMHLCKWDVKGTAVILGSDFTRLMAWWEVQNQPL